MYIISPVQDILEYSSAPQYIPQTYHPPPTPLSNHPNNRWAQPGGMEGLRGLSHPSLWPSIKHHVATSLTIIKNLTDFTQELSQMYERHGEELQVLVGNYRKKNTELRKERGVVTSMSTVWEGLLGEAEADATGMAEVGAVLGRQVSRQTLERTFHRKLQARKLLASRESLDSIITKAEEALSKLRVDYRTAYTGHLGAPGSTTAMAAYLDAHNAYVTQLHATNAMVDTYAKETLPELLQELEEVYADLCTTMSETVAQGAEVISNRAGAQSRRYCSLWSESKGMDAAGDTAALVRSVMIPAQAHPSHRLRLFTPPQVEGDEAGPGTGAPLRNQLVGERPASIDLGSRLQALNQEAATLEQEIQHLHDALNTMLRIQQRSLESSLYNKANELQEDISAKRYELKTAQLSLAAVKAQKELFSSRMEGAGHDERKMSTASSASMKSKWLKAFKSLKTPPPTNKEEKRNGKEVSPADSAHQFQEYTYKKITPCDVCSQVLRGHTRQGLKCRICKLNVHLDCQERVGKCQTKSRLLRRQKSSSEIETASARPPGPPAPNSAEETAGVHEDRASVDSTYRVLKAAGEISTKLKTRPTCSDSHSRRRKLFATMFGSKGGDKASSLPETEQVQYAAGTRPFGQPLVLAGGSTPSPRSPPRHQH